MCFSRSCLKSELGHIFDYNPVLGFGSAAIGNVTLIGVRILKGAITMDLLAPNILYMM